jgi:hypothetical protein
MSKTVLARVHDCQTQLTALKQRSPYRKNASRAKRSSCGLQSDRPFIDYSAAAKHVPHLISSVVTEVDLVHSSRHHRRCKHFQKCFELQCAQDTMTVEQRS